MLIVKVENINRTNLCNLYISRFIAKVVALLLMLDKVESYCNIDVYRFSCTLV